MGALKTICAAAALTMTLTACDSEPAGGQTPDKGAASGGNVSSGCQLPVSFDVAEKWTAKAIEDADEGGALTNQGGFAMACEIDAKPAGHLGFLRVWTSSKSGGARAALDEFLAAERNITVPEFSTVQVAGTDAAEVAYVRDNPTIEVKKRERALVVPTAKGAVLLHLGGLDDDEHDAMLPAYELAKKTMKV